MSRWPKVALSECLQQTSDIVPVERDREYPNFGIYSYARGLFNKRSINGLASSALTLRRVRRRQFVYSRLFAFEGAYGIVGDDFDGCFVSNEYPTFDCDETRILPEYLIAYFSMPRVWEAVAKGSKGLGVRRQRIQPEHVLSHAIPLAPLSEQRTIVERLIAVEKKKRQVETKLDAIEADSGHLLAMRFGEAIEGAGWKPMREVAPVVRREVDVLLEGNYPEVGVRSFGKGTFRKPPLSGADVGTKRLFRIEAGDLLFSNVFAWEGAIAVALPNDAGRFGSHRFISCVNDRMQASAEFICYYFLTPEGLEKIGKASPGGAGRNRTLGVEKLMSIEVPVPSLAKQRAFDELQSSVAGLKAKHNAIRKDLDALVPSMLERIFQSERCSS